MDQTAMDGAGAGGRMVAAALQAELDWLVEVIHHRLRHYFPERKEGVPAPPTRAPLPPAIGTDSNYARFLRLHELDERERLFLILALAPHLKPQLLDIFWSKNDDTQRGFTEFGGLGGSYHGGFLPTLETALFLLAGDDLEQRLDIQSRLMADSRLMVSGALRFASISPGEPFSSASLHIDPEWFAREVLGQAHRPDHGADFPARRIETGLEWQDLILPASTLEQLEEIRLWIRHGAQLLHGWGMRHKLKPGFTSLFYGPPGTGKTLSACLLGKYCDCEVYRIDLSLIVSKYIGETEKNLARVFDTAESRGWILFFDEADALFGKRTRVDDAHDRYANQEVSFLLQRVEDFHGVVILASNLKSNMDDAFIRRFQSIIPFPMPKTAERLKLWQNAFSDRAELEAAIDLEKIAERYDVSGGTIMNVVRFASLRAIGRNSQRILRDDVEEGLRREYAKEGRAL